MIEKKLINKIESDADIEVGEHIVKIQKGNKTVFLRREDYDRRKAEQSTQVGVKFRFAEYVDCSDVTTTGQPCVAKVYRDEIRRTR